MIRQIFIKSAHTISRFLKNPIKVIIFSLSFLAISLVLDGSLLHLWQLNRDTTVLTQRMAQLKLDSAELEKKIIRARDPNFIEVQAREKFELAYEGDLVFVFSDEE